LVARQPSSLSGNNPYPDSLIADTSPKPVDLGRVSVGEHMQHHVVDMLQKVDILEAALPKQRPNKLGKLSMPPSRCAPTSDCASAGLAQSPSSSWPTPLTTEAPERNSVSILHCSILAHN
jgi:hypothetical protein